MKLLGRVNGVETPISGGGGDSIQVDVLPTASASNLGKIYQYVGTTTLNRRNGFFYKCVPGDVAGTYEWDNIDVQYGGIGGEILCTPYITLLPNAWETYADWYYKGDGVARCGINVSYNIPESNINIIVPSEQISLSVHEPNISDWERYGVRLQQYGSNNQGYLNSIFFVCDHIPTKNLSFKIVSMPVTIIS